ncbi:coiled-coil domain-containing protein 60 isoform X1 [Saccopteryx leptura]|uniref:coiled-coil domain-containing protein 60 isoform X1 n=1 Tax=Saccopteryx leptura TaxID=249018 RepID=UPI00339C1C5F
MSKSQSTKKMQTCPDLGDLWPFYSSELPSQVPEKPVKSIRYTEKEILNLKKNLIRSRTYDADEKSKKVGAGAILPPFIPMHCCILSPLLPEGHVEPLFRQLCALHWLLEALTIDHTHHAMKPLITCWDPKDPGGSKSTIKEINKDKSVEQRWEHFITAPQDRKVCELHEKKTSDCPTKKLKFPTVHAANHKPSQRGLTLSLSRASGGSSPESSMVSMNPGSDEPRSVTTQTTGSKDIEDNESSSTKPDEEPLHISLQKLLEMVQKEAQRTITLENGMHRNAPSIFSMVRQTKSDSTYKDMQTTRKSSDRPSSTRGESHSQPIQEKSKSFTNCDLSLYKRGVCNTMKAEFDSVAQEASFCLQDKIEIFMKHEEERALQKFHSLLFVSNFQKDITKMRHKVPTVKNDAEEIAGHWYFDLLSKLPEDLKNFRPAKKILAKLQKFGENLDLRIRPHIFLKVLQDLRIWELCSPDIAGAIEFVREHIIHMPQEDYINWLQNRVSIPIWPQNAQT